MIDLPRIIAVLLLYNGGLYKTVGFSKKKYIGDPINVIKILNEKEVDEICIINISSEVRFDATTVSLLEDMASESFIPMSYGGGLRCIEEVTKVFKLGFEKVVFGASVVSNKDLVKSTVRIFGSQSVVACIDYKKNLFGKPKCYISQGKVNTKLSPECLALTAYDLGVGEVLLQNINREGTFKGYDLPVLVQVSNKLTIPVVPLGGVASLRDMFVSILNSGASAAAAGSLFVYHGEHKAVLVNYPNELERIKVFNETKQM